MNIALKLIGWNLQSEVSDESISLLIRHLSILFENKAKITINNFKELPPSNLFNKQRLQWNSDKILGWLMEKYHPSIDTKLLAVCDFDAYSNGLNFVFGQACIEGQVAAVYLPTLGEEFYGKDENNALFCERLVKEALHELGHSFGLIHCNNKMCAMYFSNSLNDTDIKSNTYCERCSEYLDPKL